MNLTTIVDSITNNGCSHEKFGKNQSQKLVYKRGKAHTLCTSLKFILENKHHS